MIRRAIGSAQKHGINLSQGTQNSADGNCAIESVINNINDRRCFGEHLPFSADYYRRIWMTDFKNRTVNDPTWNVYSNDQWEMGWKEMMVPGVYERGLFGDLMLFGIACGVKKHLLIFNTNLDSPHDPIYVCDPQRFGVQPDTNIPVVLAYNMSHYESLDPMSPIDVQKTSDLVHSYLTGAYSFGRKDLGFLLNTDKGNGENEVSAEGITNSGVNSEERPEGAKAFQNQLPENLKGKRPKDMTQDEKKEYNKYRRRKSRQNETSEERQSKNLAKAKSNAEKRKHEAPEEKKKRNASKAKDNAENRSTETKEEEKEKKLG